MPSTLNDLLTLDALALTQAKVYMRQRFAFEKIAASMKERVFKGIVGPRGVGKTVLLKQLRSREDRAIYLACDTLDPTTDLFEIVKTLKEKLGIRCFFLDEIHFLKPYDLILKKIYDFLDVQVIFTSSVALAMVQSAYDLARRCRLYTLYPFSFREYLFFAKEVVLPPLPISDLIIGKYTPDYLRHAHLFEAYLCGELYPFCLDAIEPLPLFENVLDKIIEKDAAVVANLAPAEQYVLKKMARFVASSPVDGLNVTSIAKNMGITKYKAEQYISILERAFILQVVLPRGTNVLKEPKILMHLPYRLLFRSYQDCKGALREDFFIESMKMANQPLFYLKTSRGEKTPDYWIQLPDGPIVIEIGGKGKGRTQFKGITDAKTVILGDKIASRLYQHPLFLAGCF